MEVQVPDGARYIIFVCLPAGEQTKIEARWDDGQMDAIAALEMVQLGTDDLTRQAAVLMRQAARMRLMQPLAVAVAEPPRETANSAPSANGAADDSAKKGSKP